MSDTALPQFLGQMDTAAMAAYTPTPPPTVASWPDALYLLRNSDDGLLYYWDGAAWAPVTSGAAGSLTLLTADPASPADDTFWGKRTGAGPYEITFNVRIGGVTTSFTIGTTA